LDSSGYPLVAYLNASNNDLKLMHCNDPNCTGGDESITSPDTAGNVGFTASLALDNSGHPVVSYYDAGNGNLKLMHCNDPNCTGGDESITSPDTAGFAGQYTSLVLDSIGHPVVSYTSDSNTNLKLMNCNDPNCTGGDESITSPDSTSRFVNYTSIQLDSSGYPVIS
jgi:hypothetical protein